MAVRRQRDARFESHLFEFSAALVMEQRVNHRVVGHEQIRPAIEIVIRNAHTHAFSRVRAKSPFRGNVAERSVAVVEEELVGCRLVKVWMAIVADAGLNIASGLGSDIPGEVIEDEQIEQAVVVDIEPGSAN